MEDVMKFEKVKIYVEENEVDQEILEQAEIKLSIRAILKKKRNNADKLTRLEDVKIPRTLIIIKSNRCRLKRSK
jgi:tRNA uridine 5-carboxymethylaminomethyl modification enzyme